RACIKTAAPPRNVLLSREAGSGGSFSRMLLGEMLNGCGCLRVLLRRREFFIICVLRERIATYNLAGCFPSQRNCFSSFSRVHAYTRKEWRRLNQGWRDSGPV